MSGTVDVWANSLKAINERKASALPVSVDVTASVIEAFLEGGDTAEVDALDLYEVIFRDQKAKIESLQTINDSYKSRASNHARACAEYESRIAALTSTCNELSEAISQGGASSSNAASSELSKWLADEVAKNQELTAKFDQAMQASSATIADLNEQVALYEKERQSFIDNFGNVKAVQQDLTHKLELEQGENQVLKNRILTVEGHAKEAAKASEQAIRGLQKKCDSLTRSLDVANKEVGKEKERRAEMLKGNMTAIDAMKEAKRKMDDMEAEIAELRTNRRYLIMMIDCINRDYFHSSEEGLCGILTYATKEFSSPDDDFVFDKTFPVGLWINKQNGFSCIVGVSMPAEDGTRSVVLPRSDKVSKRATDAICPPKKDLEPILNGLMQCTVTECKQQVDFAREKVSRLAVYGEHQENLIQDNKNLIATTKSVVAGGRTAVPNRSGHSAKRAPKRRR